MKIRRILIAKAAHLTNDGLSLLNVVDRQMVPGGRYPAVVRALAIAVTIEREDNKAREVTIALVDEKGRPLEGAHGPCAATVSLGKAPKKGKHEAALHNVVLDLSEVKVPSPGSYQAVVFDTESKKALAVQPLDLL